MKTGYVIIWLAIAAILGLVFRTVRTMDIYASSCDVSYNETQNLMSGYMNKKADALVQVVTGTIDNPESTGDYDMGDEWLNDIFGF